MYNPITNIYIIFEKLWHKMSFKQRLKWPILDSKRVSILIVLSSFANITNGVRLFNKQLHLYNVQGTCTRDEQIQGSLMFEKFQQI